MEHWVEINLDAKVAVQDGVLLDILLPFVRGLQRRGRVVSFHYFREPEIRFRVRLRDARTKKRVAEKLAKVADSLLGRKLVSEWHFGNHGERGADYCGEADRYGPNGWEVAQGYFMRGSEAALKLLDLKRHSKLENALWAKGLGNQWEGGKRNPWRERQEDPLAFHWSRFVHLFSNQLGFDMEREAALCQKQAEKYREVVKEVGLRW